MNSVAIEAQITALRLPPHGDEQRKFASPLILLSPEAGRRWELKAVFPFPPQRLSLPSLKLEGNPWGDPNPWNRSSCAFLLSQIINYHALYIHCTNHGKNSTKLPSAEYILPRNMNGFAVGRGGGGARHQGARSWLHTGSQWSKARDNSLKRTPLVQQVCNYRSEWALSSGKSLPSGKAFSNVWREACSSQGFQDFPDSLSDGISGIYKLVASLSCTLFANLYSCNILPLQASKIFSRFSEKFWSVSKQYLTICPQNSDQWK